MYTSTKVRLFNNQHDTLRNAFTHQKPTSIKLNLDHSGGGGGGGGGEHTLLFTRGQIEKIERSSMIGKHQITIDPSKRQVKANVQHQGGFLDMLARLVAKTLPSLLRAPATGLVSGAVERAVGRVGNGLYLHKLGHCVKINPVHGNGLYLTPHKSLPAVHGDELYLKRGSTIQDASRLILGENSPFKNIPILNLL